MKTPLLLIGAAVVTAFATTATAFSRDRTRGALLQMVGCSCLLVVVGTHIAEELGILPGFGWGQRNSVGHYIDLTSAVLGVSCLIAGSLIR